MMKKIVNSAYLILAIVALSACSKDDHIVGGKANETNKVNQTTFEFLKSFEITTETAKLIERAGMIEVVNGDVTVFAPSNYAVSRYLRRKTNRMLRLDPKSSAMTISDIPADELKQLGMYVVDKKYWSSTIPAGGIVVPTRNPGDSVRITMEQSTAEPGAAWDGGGAPGQGYQYSNFMQSRPEKVAIHFKRGNKWEMTATQRTALGFDNPECDQLYKMYISDILTNTGAVHVLYSGDNNYSDHNYYHSLFFFGTRTDDKL
jgi:hypothetical protein